ncbi:hypothetical protein E0485_17960 [Paenibacillus albiflavus]|uniref:DUF4129 domain-containing protein n=1 Tax=Paenibacillus albiflavus TaxID=2545760 RepID=A0A4R4E811_9BACL|nr:hypothetical protein [Paenibacillus albiflavus]TCZ75277.1 hypothetical protein E0485_17960 [Paenibacillus albiflavus]
MMELQRPSLSMLLKRITHSILYAGIELLMFVPFVIITYLILSPVSLGTWVVLLWTSYLCGALVAAIRISRAIWFYALLLVISILLVALITSVSFGLVGILMVALCCYLIYRGTQMIVYEWDSIFPPTAFVIGIICYFVASIASVFSIDLEPYKNLFLWTGLASLIVTLFQFNQQHLQNKTPGNRRVSRTVVSKNRLWTFILIGLIVFFSFVYVLDQIVNWMLQGAAYLAQLLVSWLSTNYVPESPPIQDFSPVEEMPQQEELSQWGDVILFIFVGILILIFLFLCYILFPKIREAINRFIQFIKRLLTGKNKIYLNSGYHDEKKQLQAWEDIRSSVFQSLKNKWNNLMKREPKWSELTNWRERVRWIYKHKVIDAIGKGFNYQKELTPDETMKAIVKRQVFDKEINEQEFIELANSYNKARYGNEHESMSDDQVIRLKK